MGILIALLFLLLPLAEIATFVLVGREVGVGTTLMLVLASMFAGIVLLRVQGLGTLRRLQQATAKGGDPGRELVHGVMIVIAGILLILPGFLSDLIGLLLFIPPVRDFAWKLIRSRMTVISSASSFQFSRGSDPYAPEQTKARSGSKIVDLDDDEFSRDDTDRPSRPNGPNRLQ
ncbi:MULTISPECIES: FxsA family protein [unclassified Rhizobium]|uniref:FxsA family protein n=1 Tax=unclassified Rhizobium TaxID=2613769 RepID=UPI000700E896|nr:MULTISPECIES: FxsA family protein [unclassified Rhizobium]KQV35831.1 hypothetical protein ASC86_11635 [Rhizobium sp. Root1212]KRD25938.1 hypothetical protein ASE37_11630 [Rhizobium sp. Root268]